MKLFEGLGFSKKPKEDGEKKEIVYGMIHADFEDTDYGFQGNQAYKAIESTIVESLATKKIFARRFTFTEADIINGMLEEEECRWPVKIKRLDGNNFEGYAYSTEKGDANIEDWVYHHNGKETNEYGVAA
jgi:CRISPR/Cas system CSM-associated protein Csm3 (group 7 of RAMP superfamily)